MESLGRVRVGILCVVAGWALLGLGLVGGPATAEPVMFDEWTVEGAADAGDWQVSDDGMTVRQQTNGAPTFFVSPDDLTVDTFTGSITVDANAGDGDYFGVVLGYTNPLGDESVQCDTEDCRQDYVLFDWKHDDQDVAKAGMSLVRINRDDDVRTTNGGDCFWPHTDSPETGCDVLATDYAPEKGWQFGVTYDLRFTYTASRIKVERIEDPNAPITIFDVTGTFPAGRVGFYNYSQAGVTYAGFDATQSPTTTTLSTTSSTTSPTSSTSSTTSSSTPTSTSTSTSTSTPGPTPTTAPSTSTTARPTTTTGAVAAGTLARTGNGGGTGAALVGGAALIAMGALLTALRGGRPVGKHFIG